jgi:ElaB/YqjD/DUF883 family membrane-anchored ribosome-binding protein
MNNLSAQTTDTSRRMADQAAARLNDGIDATRDAIDSGLDSAQSGVNSMRAEIPAKLGQAASEIERIARLGMERAMDACHTVKERVDSASESTVSYVRKEPVKSVLIAAASGAVLMGALSLWARIRSQREHSLH